MTNIPEEPFLRFKRYIRDTLFFDMGKPDRPFIKLRGRNADYNFELQAGTIDLFGWAIIDSKPVVFTSADGSMKVYGWFCAGCATGEEFRYALTSVGLGHIFSLTWSSDKRILSRNVQGPVVDVLNTEFDCHLSAPWRSANPDWDQLEENFERLSILVKLKMD